MTASWNMCSKRASGNIFLPFGRGLWPYGHKNSKKQKINLMNRLIFLFLKDPPDFIRKHPSRTPFCLKYSIMHLYSVLSSLSARNFIPFFAKLP